MWMFFQKTPYNFYIRYSRALSIWVGNKYQDLLKEKIFCLHASVISYKTVEEIMEVLPLLCFYGWEGAFTKTVLEMYRRDHSVLVYCMVGDR